MKSTEDIFRVTIGIPFSQLDRVPAERVKECMLAAMKEAIIECARVATVRTVDYGNPDPFEWDKVVDSNSILSLIDELK